MNNLASQPESYRAVSMEVADLFDEGDISMCLRMDNGEAITVMCSAESLLSIQSDISRRIRSHATLAQWSTNDDAYGDFNDNAAGS